MTTPITPEWDACEDCMATGGQRDENGEGSCGSCGGAGRRPANAAARAEVVAAETRRQDRAYEAAQRAYDDR